MSGSPDVVTGQVSPHLQVRQWLSLDAEHGQVYLYGNGQNNPVLDSHEAAVRVLSQPDLLAACEYVKDMLQQEFPDGKGGTETMAMKLAGAGGVCALAMIQKALAKSKWPVEQQP